MLFCDAHLGPPLPKGMGDVYAPLVSFCDADLGPPLLKGMEDVLIPRVSIYVLILLGHICVMPRERKHAFLCGPLNVYLICVLRPSMCEAHMKTCQSLGRG